MKTKTIQIHTIQKVLCQVIDPEIGCNVVDLGLIYDIALSENKVTVTMTLTTPGCPMQESMAEGVRSALLSLDEIEEAVVQVVWDPPWNPQMMTAMGRSLAGITLG
jgi:metal-sulfur cluster biosynthetic enzyme